MYPFQIKEFKSMLPLFSNFSIPSLLDITLIIGFGALFFLATREIIAWYWKINKIIRILERIERNTRKEGVKYPDDEFDEEYFRRNGIKIPGENTVIAKTEDKK